MTIEEIRKRYLKFFESKGHTIISPAPLVLENDPTTLFTSSGMQPLVPYLLGETHPSGNRLVDSQPSIRVQDIEEVGDNRHTTFFEMLGNWSLGDYFKKEQLGWIYEFLTVELKLPIEKLYVSIFEGNDSVPRDTESYQKWIDLGVSKDHIFEYGVKKNWWSRAGTPDQMPEGEIGGPDSEIFFDFGEHLHLHENSEWKSEKCHPNCDCGRFLEIGNSVFIQYKKHNEKLVELPQKNVDFGGGLERMAAATNNDPDVFKIDVFEKIIGEVEKITSKKYISNEKEMRIIADHFRASNALSRSGIAPSNKLQGYVMRRLIRRATLKLKNLKKNIEKTDLEKLTTSDVVLDEFTKFEKTLERGLREFEKVESLDGKIAFDLYQTYGFPLELTLELAKQDNKWIDSEFSKEFEKHKELSRSASAGVFKGGLADHSEEVTRLHTATHLLHAALRKVLGIHVKQKGSNITSERLRFDFVHTEKVTPVQISEIETLINAQVDRDLPVSFEMMTIEEADKKGALHFFDKKYEEKVKVYTIGNSETDFFSKEVCGGPHITHLSELHGHVKITKEEAVSAGVRRIYATIQ